MIEYQPIWDEVISNFHCELNSIHGREHWRRVEDVGLKIVKLAGKADVDVVRLFAVLHDSCRRNDNHDPQHGMRAAEYAKMRRGRLFDLDDEKFELLYTACAWHADGEITSNLTVGACWDADRMDLRRVGIEPDPSFFSTPEVRQIVLGKQLFADLSEREILPQDF